RDRCPDRLGQGAGGTDGRGHSAHRRGLCADDAARQDDGSRSREGRAGARARGSRVLIVPAPSFVLAALLAAGSALAADSIGYRKAYFGATKPGAWAQYTMRVEGQPELRMRSTRLADANGEQHLEARLDVKVQGKAEASFTEYTLQKGYSLENDALG